MAGLRLASGLSGSSALWGREHGSFMPSWYLYNAEVILESFLTDSRRSPVLDLGDGPIVDVIEDLANS